MESEAASIVLGVILVIAGSIMLKFYFQKLDEELEEKPENQPLQPHIYSQLRRRFHVAVIILVLGFLIPICENLVTEKRPTLYVFCMSGVLLLAFWIIFLGMIDFMLVRTRAKGSLQMIDNRKKELLKQMEEIRKDNQSENDSSSGYHDVNLN